MEVFGVCVGVLSDSEIAVARARIAAGNRATAARIEPRRGEIGRFCEEQCEMRRGYWCACGYLWVVGGQGAMVSASMA